MVVLEMLWLWWEGQEYSPLEAWQNHPRLFLYPPAPCREVYENVLLQRPQVSLLLVGPTRQQSQQSPPPAPGEGHHLGFPVEERYCLHELHLLICRGPLAHNLLYRGRLLCCHQHKRHCDYRCWCCSLVHSLKERLLPARPRWRQWAGWKLVAPEKSRGPPFPSPGLPPSLLQTWGSPPCPPPHPHPPPRQLLLRPRVRLPRRRQ
mmetsp:Transcript_639/g.1484  ORF Transcript_639/g.1484 Transcript_639/m.1484 type:complete len:205 (+) Transcript_639:148-762(+)